MKKKGQIEVELQDVFGNDRSIAEMAWTSSSSYQGKKAKTDEDVSRVVNMLADMKHCFDSKTEILTRTGWKKFPELTYEDEVASVEKNSHKILWTKPNEIITSYYDGPMYYVNSGMVNFKVTPNHDLYLSVKKNRGWATARKYKPTELTSSPKKLYSSATEHLGSIDESEFSLGCLYGFFLGDGFWKSKSTVAFRLKKKRKVDFIKRVLTILGLDFKEIIDSRGVVNISFTSNYLTDFFGREKAGSRYVHPTVFYRTPSFKLGVFEGLKKSNGTKKRNAWSFSSSSKKLIKDFDTLGASLGFVVKPNKPSICKKSITHHRRMVLSRSVTPLFNDSKLGTSNKLKTVSYKGTIHCVNVDTGLVLVRRQGCPMISGNSTPFEGVVLRFWMRIPIFTDRQHVTHRIASHSGQSSRYRTMPSDFFSLPDDVVNIQIKAGIDSNIIDDYHKICTLSNQFYRMVLDKLKQSEKSGTITNSEYKRVRELVRGVLPQSNMVERVTVINLRSFANYQKLRNSEHAQPEIRTLAQLMLEELEASNKCPIAIEALKRNNWSI